MGESMENTDTAPDAAPQTDALEDLLAEYDAGTQAPKPAFEPDQAARQASEALRDHMLAQRESLQLDQRSAELRAHEQALQQEYDQRDAAAAFSEIRGSLSPEMFDDAMIDSWIAAQAARDPTIGQVWQNRAVDPKAYQRTLARLAGEFGEKFRRFQTESEVDYAAVAQAVRGQGGKAPAEPPPNLSRMGDAEFRQHVIDAYGYDPA